MLFRSLHSLEERAQLRHLRQRDGSLGVPGERRGLGGDVDRESGPEVRCGEGEEGGDEGEERGGRGEDGDGPVGVGGAHGRLDLLAAQRPGTGSALGGDLRLHLVLLLDLDRLGALGRERDALDESDEGGPSSRASLHLPDLGCRVGLDEAFSKRRRWRRVVNED